jgi:hypothetical protein
VAVKAAHFARPPGLGLDGHEHGGNIRVRRVLEYSIFSQLSGSKRAKVSEFMPILKDFSLTWQSLDNCMLGDAQINQDKTPAG